MVMFVISRLVETNRAPFDLPEAEAKSVVSNNVEYARDAILNSSLLAESNVPGSRGLILTEIRDGSLPTSKYSILGKSSESGEGAEGGVSSSTEPSLPTAEEEPRDQTKIERALDQIELSKIKEQKDRFAKQIIPLIESEKVRLVRRLWHHNLGELPSPSEMVKMIIDRFASKATYNANKPNIRIANLRHLRVRAFLVGRAHPIRQSFLILKQLPIQSLKDRDQVPFSNDMTNYSKLILGAFIGSLKMDSCPSGIAAMPFRNA
ncbi:NADH-ubiquinone oxidoreductase chain 1 [Capsicum baccatum]|uniref:NADH-ubiquinone oxidoreductase chain 1 n=1 Tax=Capsicum baccatum TaxID=33114 RepID=A0A2G2WNR3_CAPBA|nr:NADH-ubiquinone oxidoreductase chain 1 [Capsicum baccatum]